MARRNGNTKFNQRKAQGHVKDQRARLKQETRATFDIESLKLDGYKLVGFEETK